MKQGIRGAQAETRLGLSCPVKIGENRPAG